MESSFKSCDWLEYLHNGSLLGPTVDIAGITQLCTVYRIIDMLDI